MQCGGGENGDRVGLVREGADEVGEENFAIAEEVEVEEFVLGVGLVDGAGADADGGEAGGGEVGGVGEPWGAGGFGAGVGGEEFLDEGVGRIGLHGWVFVGVGNFQGEAKGFDGVADEF